MKHKLARSALAVLILSLLSAASLSTAHALSWDGSSSGGGGASKPTSPGGYAVRYSNAESCVVGYRFSVINSSGTTKGYVIDVYKGSGGFNNPKFSSKYNKADLIRLQDASWSTSYTTYQCVQQSQLGISLPAPSGMGSWQGINTNLNAVLKAIQGDFSVDTLIYGDKVLVEPIIEIAISGTYYSFTVTEMALYGKHMLGAYSNGGSSSTSGSWGFIATYTNKNFPNLLRASDGYGIWTGVSSALTSQATFYDIINSGYGVGVAFTQMQNRYFTNTVNHWAWGFNGEGNNGAKNAFYLGPVTYNVEQGAWIEISQGLATSIPNGFYLAPQFSSPSISGSWASYDYGYWLSQPNYNMEFEFDYMPYTYQITYDLGGGTNSPYNPSTYNVLYGVTFSDPTREGYTFAGWYIGDTQVTGINPGANAWFSSAADMYAQLAWRTTGDVTVTARWVSNTATNTIGHWATGFINGEGTNDWNGSNAYLLGDTSFTAEYGSWIGITPSLAISIPNGFYLDPQFITSSISGSWESYSFDYWLNQPSYNMQMEYHYTPYTYQITYDLDDGVNAASNPSTYNVLYGVTFADPTREGYTFAGWYIGDTQVTGINPGADAWFDSSADLYAQLASRTTGDVTVTAKWISNNFTNEVSHWAWGFERGEGTNPTQNAFGLGSNYFDAMLDTKFVLSEALAITPPNGFYLAPQLSSPSISGSWAAYDIGTVVTQIRGSMLFEYNYFLYTYQITYDLDGGVNAASNPSTYNVLYGVTFADPTREGYTFAGWYIGDTQVTGINPGADAWFDSSADLYAQLASRTTGDVTVTAKWIPNGYTILFDGNGATGGSTPSMSMTYGVAKNLTPNGFIRTGYTFVGWNTRADGSGTTYADQQSVKNLTSVNGATVTLYAQWQERLVLEPIAPNAAYREGTEVITSYWLINDSDRDYTPSDHVTLRFDIRYPDGSLYQSLTKEDVVVPAHEQNLVYIKWTVPEDLTGRQLTILVYQTAPEDEQLLTSRAYTTAEYTMYQTPDTQFQYSAPAGSYGSAPRSQSANVTWTEFVYEGGSFVEKSYQFVLLPREFELIPNSASAIDLGSRWSMKSGYGFFCVGQPLELGTVSAGNLQPPTEAYTLPQYTYALYPEYGYAYGEDQCTTLLPGEATLPEFLDYGKVHFTPIWYPDGDYTVSIVSSDCWTPMGMVKTTSTQSLQIQGSVYDDWYIQ